MCIFFSSADCGGNVSQLRYLINVSNVTVHLPPGLLQHNKNIIEIGFMQYGNQHEGYKNRKMLTYSVVGS